MEKIATAIISVAGCGLAVLLGALQLEVRQLGDEVRAMNTANVVEIERLKQCERLAFQILQEDEDNDIGGERIARELFDKRGCSELQVND